MLGSVSTIKLSKSFADVANEEPMFPGSLPLLPGEDAQAYHKLRARITEAVNPADLFEMIWADDIVNDEWELGRIRRAKAVLIESERDRAETIKTLPLLCGPAEDD